MSDLNHPIVKQSFAAIDGEVGQHNLNEWEYAIARRVIHATADFDFLHLLHFSPQAIESGISALARGVPIVADVGMVKLGIKSAIAKTFNNPLIAAIEQAPSPLPGKTRTETGLIQCFRDYPQAIYVFGNAPTALLALCSLLRNAAVRPPLVIGATVGFVSVIESKQVLSQTAVPQIRVEGRKGGSAVAAAIVNALLILAWENAGNRNDG
ncbi:MAG: cobalt-precorrin-8X methylmutase [Cyanobacteriota bacterium]|nr:cobalt-precorrin-8X methylmutase [Cyanobacteriota bacterium]